MSVTKPKPGTCLGNDSDQIMLVIERGWSDERIRACLADHMDGDPSAVDYKLQTFRYHTAAQNLSEDHSEYETYWSTEGWGRTSIDVAVVDS